MISIDGIVNKFKTGCKILVGTMDSPFLDSDRVFPYLGILYLLSLAKDSGYRVKYIKKLHESKKYIDYYDIFYTNSLEFEEICDYKYFDIISLSVFTPQAQQAKDLMKRIKRYDKDKIVIIGGPHAMYYSDECIDAGYDLIVQGEGERIFQKFFEGDIEFLKRHLKNNTDGSSLVIFDKIPGKLMNSQPVPLRERDYIFSYKYELEGKWATTMVNSRGCPMSCKFCEHSNTEGRRYSPDHFEEEVNSIMDIGIDAIMIFDDLFALSSKVLNPYAEILKKYHNSRGLIYRCFTHSRSVYKDSDLIPMLAQSGCVEVGFGAESNSQTILNIIGKNTTVEMNRKLIETCIAENIKVKGFFMYGLPGETQQSASQTYDFIKHHRQKYPSMFGFDVVVFFPYKGTLIGNAARLKDGQSIRIGNKNYTNKSFDIRLKPGITWQEIDNNSYGAYKKKLGGSDAIVETYCHNTNELLLSSEEIVVWKEETMKYCNRYHITNKVDDFYVVKEGNI